MANFELLIKKALGTQDASSQAVRNSIYQSSRNALQKIIDSNRSLSLEDAIMQKQELENSIARIEDEYTAPPPEPELIAPQQEQPFIIPPEGAVDEPIQPVQQTQPIESQKPQLVDENDPLYEIQQILTGQDPAPTPVEPIYPVPASNQAPQPQPQQIDVPQMRASDTIVSEAEPNFDTVDENIHVEAVGGHDGHVDDDQHILNDEISLDEPDQAPIQFQQRRGKQKRWFGWVAFLIILLLLIWLGIYAYRSVIDGSLFGLNVNGQSSLDANLNDADYINILTPIDSSSLIISGRGSAELVTQQNTNMLRLISERSAEDLATPAQPILIRLKPGVLEKMANKIVTVEIFAKSGDSDQAQFSISCDFANGGACGRKRFVTGIQPQASVFNFEFGDVPDIDADYYLAINTDTTAEAAQSGKGSMLDIIYARLRVN